MTENDLNELRHRFTYHPPTAGQPEAYERVRMDALDFALRIVSLCPPSRETSLALTHLETAVMFANAAIARHGLREEEL